VPRWWSRSSELEERPGHGPGPDPSFLCPTGRLPDGRDVRAVVLDETDEWVSIVILSSPSLAVGPARATRASRSRFSSPRRSAIESCWTRACTRPSNDPGRRRTLRRRRSSRTGLVRPPRDCVQSRIRCHFLLNRHFARPTFPGGSSYHQWRFRGPTSSAGLADQDRCQSPSRRQIKVSGASQTTASTMKYPTRLGQGE
jgi:hypothetical protein